MSDDQVPIKKESESMLSCCSDGDHYPYGTGISFEDDIVSQLGVDQLAVGDVVELRGCAFVDSKSEHTSKENSSKSIRFQLTSVKIRRKTDDDKSKILYGG